MLASSAFTLAVAALAGLSQAQPLAPRAGTVSCSDDSTVGTLKYHQSAFHGSVDPVHIFTSAGGQQQLSIGNGTDIKIRGRKCSSAHLGLTYDDDATKTQPTKLFLFDDESKCIQRHAAVHANGPRSTHVTIEDCSNVDDTTQGRQFWLSYGNFTSSSPYYKSSSASRISLGTEKRGNDYILYESLDYSNNNYLKLV